MSDMQSGRQVPELGVSDEIMLTATGIAGEQFLVLVRRPSEFVGQISFEGFGRTDDGDRALLDALFARALGTVFAAPEVTSVSIDVPTEADWLIKGLEPIVRSIQISECTMSREHYSRLRPSIAETKGL